MGVPPQVPPAPANGPLERYWEDISPLVSGVSGPGSMQDPHHLDVAYHGVVDYHPQLLVCVTNSYLSEPPFDNNAGNRTLRTHSPM